MKRKNVRTEQDEDYYFPPNDYYSYEPDPVVTKKMFQALEPNIKTGLRNFKILNVNSMGRYGVCPDYNRVPESERGRLLLRKYGYSYASDWILYKRYIGFANSPYNWRYAGASFIDPAERNQIFGVVNRWSWYNPDIQKYDITDNLNVFPQGSYFSDLYGSRPPKIVRDESYLRDGLTFQFDNGEYIDSGEWKTSKVCRTIKSRR